MYLGQLEEALHSDLMLPHVCDILMSLGFVHLDGPLSTQSSTNVKIVHEVFKDLGQADPGRAAWVAEVCRELVGHVDAELARNAGRTLSQKDQKYFVFLGAVRALLNPFSVGWNLCKVCTVLGGALGSTTKLRNGAANPVAVKKAVVAKLSATAGQKRAGGRARGSRAQPKIIIQILSFLSHPKRRGRTTRMWRTRRKNSSSSRRSSSRSSVVLYTLRIACA